MARRRQLRSASRLYVRSISVPITVQVPIFVPVPITIPTPVRCAFSNASHSRNETGNSGLLSFTRLESGATHLKINIIKSEKPVQSRATRKEVLWSFGTQLKSWNDWTHWMVLSGMHRELVTAPASMPHWYSCCTCIHAALAPMHHDPGTARPRAVERNSNRIWLNTATRNENFFMFLKKTHSVSSIDLNCPKTFDPVDHAVEKAVPLAADSILGWDH